MSDSARLPLQRCPCCGWSLDAASVISENPTRYLPKRGDLTVCFYCSSTLRFSNLLTLVIPTPSQLQRAFKENPELEHQIDSLKLAIMKSRNRKISKEKLQ